MNDRLHKQKESVPLSAREAPDVDCCGHKMAAVVCAAVPAARTAYILAGEYRCEKMLVASTVSLTTLASILSLVVWLYGLSGLAARIAPRS
jgi:hypothetical protein